MRGKLIEKNNAMVCFSWLHLTDLHWGMEGQRDLLAKSGRKVLRGSRARYRICQAIGSGPVHW